MAPLGGWEVGEAKKMECPCLPQGLFLLLLGDLAGFGPESFYTGLSVPFSFGQDCRAWEEGPEEAVCPLLTAEQG